jgi:hypothetical protein
LRDDYVRPQRDQFFRERLKSVRLALAKAIVHPQIAPIRPTKPFKSLPQTRKACLQVPIAFFAREQHTNARHSVGLLRTDRERPRCRCSTEKAHELTSPHIRTQVQETALYRLKRVL